MSQKFPREIEIGDYLEIGEYLQGPVCKVHLPSGGKSQIFRFDVRSSEQPVALLANELVTVLP